jgi:hypothetical protein
MVQHMQTNKHNTTYKQKQGQKSHDHLKRCSKSLLQNSTSPLDKLGIGGMN